MDASSNGASMKIWEILGETASCGSTSSGAIATVMTPMGIQPPKGQFFGGDPSASIYGPIKANRKKRKKVRESVTIRPNKILQSYVDKFLNLWTAGETQALKFLSPMVKKELKKSVTGPSYHLFRGYKFEDEWWVKERLGKDLSSLKVGDTIQISLTSPTSWSKSEKIAAKFANPRYNSFQGRNYTSREIATLGYDEGDELGWGLLVSAEIPAAEVMADLSNCGDSFENEVIVQGTVTAKILGIQHHVFTKKSRLRGTND